MYPYDYSDYLQLHRFSTDLPTPDYDFDDQVKQYAADYFTSEDKGHLVDSCSPISSLLLSESDEFGSSSSSSSSTSSRSPSITTGSTSLEDLDEDDHVLNVFPIPFSPKREHITEIISDEPASLPSSSPRLQLFTASPINSPRLTNNIVKDLRDNPPSPILQGTRKRAATRHVKSVLSDEEADEETDGGTDDEYIPSPQISSIKRRRISYNSPRRSVPIARRSMSASLDPGSKRAPGATLSRNKQSATPAIIEKVCEGASPNFVCPECGWRQVNRRLPDFKRHLRTHTRPSEADQTKGWWCKGVAVGEAHFYDIPNDAVPFEFLGQQRIGGCMQTFSRRDALKRHLDNTNVVCVGRPGEATED